MPFNPYDHLGEQDLNLTDYLAIDRTVLANERTALAYGRTFLAMLAIGGTLIHFFVSWWMWTIGGLFIIGGFVVMGIGWRRYRRTQQYLAAALSRRTGDPKHPLRDKVADPPEDGESEQQAS